MDAGVAGDTFDVQGGTIQGAANGALAGSLHLEAGATLSLTGDAFAPFYITGDYTQDAGSTMWAGIWVAEGLIPELDVTGTVTLAGTLSVVTEGYPPPFSVVLITAGNNITTDFAGFDWNNSWTYSTDNATNPKQYVLGSALGGSVAFAPTVASLSQASGTTAGGTSITITGTNFLNVDAVLFDAAPDNQFTINSSTSITISTPPAQAGTIDVAVVTTAATSALSIADRYTYVPVGPPAIDSFSTSMGSAAGGTVVTITGARLNGASELLFGDVPATSYIIESDTVIAAVAPPEAAGVVDVSVVTPTGTSALTAADEFTYTNASLPTVSALGVSTGTTAGGAVVTVSGSGFTGATGVSFGGVPAASFSVLSDGTLVATAPPQAAGTVDVTVSTYAGTSAAVTADHFTYTAASAPTVSGVTPGSGTSTGGATVVVTGSGFTGAAGVSFGGVAADDFEVLDDNTIEVTAPASTTTGTVDVTVTTYAGTSSTSGDDHFTYDAPTRPTVTALSTGSGTTAGGTMVTLTGTGFSDVSEVDFGGVPVYDFVVNSDSQLTVLAPAQPAGTVDVSVVSDEGTSSASSATRFTYSLASLASVSSLGATGGSTGGGNTVLINGSHFTGATDVSFGAVDADDFTVLSDSLISAVVPAQAAGTIDVRVTTYSGSSAPTSSDQYTYTAASAPAVSSLATTTGSSAGGTLVTLSGSGFTGASAVSFGGVPAGFTVNSDTSITA